MQEQAHLLQRSPYDDNDDMNKNEKNRGGEGRGGEKPGEQKCNSLPVRIVFVQTGQCILLNIENRSIR